jgi:hypothetical protein
MRAIVTVVSTVGSGATEFSFDGTHVSSSDCLRCTGAGPVFWFDLLEYSWYSSFFLRFF